MGLMDWDEEEYLLYTGDAVKHPNGYIVYVPDDEEELIDACFGEAYWSYKGSELYIVDVEGSVWQGTYYDLREYFRELVSKGDI